MKDRISKILREEGMTATKFANEIGVQASSISHIISGRNKPSTDFLVKLLDRFRGINAEWLLTGKGSMYKESTSNTSSDSGENSSNDTDLFSSKPQNDEEIDENGQNVEGNPKKLIENTNYIPENSNSHDSGLNEFPPVTSKSSKTIEKVVVFFTDKTFESYDPK